MGEKIHVKRSISAVLADVNSPNTEDGFIAVEQGKWYTDIRGSEWLVERISGQKVTASKMGSHISIGLSLGRFRSMLSVQSLTESNP